jgi:hypothetical protein
MLRSSVTMQSVFILSVTNESIMLNAIMLIVVMLNVVAPKKSIYVLKNNQGHTLTFIF